MTRRRPTQYVEPNLNGLCSASFIVVLLGVLLMVVERGADDTAFVQNVTDRGRRARHSSNPFFQRTVHQLPGPSGTVMEAWLHVPRAKFARRDPSSRWPNTVPPVVVIAGEVAAQRDFGLTRYAVELARLGIASLVFDYRGFGGSQGLPRHVVSPRAQMADWRAVVEYLASGRIGHLVDGSRIGVLGTSYSGGHVITLLRQRSGSFYLQVKCGAAVAPYYSAVPTVGAVFAAHGVLAGSWRLARLGANGFRDVLHGSLAALHSWVFPDAVPWPSPHYIRIHGPVGASAPVALFDDKGAEPRNGEDEGQGQGTAYGRIVPARDRIVNGTVLTEEAGFDPEADEFRWANAVGAAVVLRTLIYSPGMPIKPKSVRRPLLVVPLLGDGVVRAEMRTDKDSGMQFSTEDRRVTMFPVKGTHWDIYEQQSDPVSAGDTDASRAQRAGRQVAEHVAHYFRPRLLGETNGTKI